MLELGASWLLMQVQVHRYEHLNSADSVYLRQKNTVVVAKQIQPNLIAVQLKPWVVVLQQQIPYWYLWYFPPLVQHHLIGGL